MSAARLQVSSSGTDVVFGGSGFIGRHLLSHLVARGRNVVSADIVPLDPPIEGVHAVHCDVRRSIPIDLVPTELGGYADRIYNLAAVHRTPGHPDREYYDTNVSGALNVTAYCQATEATKLVFTSSISVYGPAEVPTDETSQTGPRSPYGCSKLQAEEIQRRWQVAEPGRRLVIVRPAVVFGAGERGNFTRLARALRRRVFFYPGRRDTIKACGYVHDLLDSLDFSCEIDRPSFLYNFCYPRPYTIEEICQGFHEVAKYPLPWGTMPYTIMRCVATPFDWFAKVGMESGIHRERIDKLVQSTNIAPRALVDSGYAFGTDLVSGLQSWNRLSDGRFV